MPRKKKTEEITEKKIQEQDPSVIKDEPKYTEYIVSPAVKGSMVNARAADRIDAPILAKLKDGQIVRSYKKPGSGWIQIDLDGQTAYVMSTKLKKK